MRVIIPQESFDYDHAVRIGEVLREEQRLKRLKEVKAIYNEREYYLRDDRLPLPMYEKPKRSFNLIKKIKYLIP